jgi:hypothetical protein
VSRFLTLYAVRSQDGKWFRRKGYGGYGASWVDDVEKARIYTKIGHAQTQVSWWSEHYPEYGVPDIVALHVTQQEVLDEKDRVEKAQLKRQQAKQASALRREQTKLEVAQRKVDDARAELARLKG